MRGGAVDDSVLAAKEKDNLLLINSPNEAHKAGYMKVAASLESRLCFCAVFDECYVVDSRKKPVRSTRIDKCPVPATPYAGDLTGLALGKAGEVRPASVAASAAGNT